MVRDTADAFARAVDAAGCDERWLVVAGLGVRLRFAGPALVDRLLPALAHAVSDSRLDTGLTIDLFDSASTGIPFDCGIAPDERGGTADEAGGQWLIAADGLTAAFHGLSGVLSAIDSGGERAFWWIEDAAQVPWFEQAAPMRTIFHWWLRRHGVQFLHAAAVETARGGVLLGGKGGSGKSTAALECAVNGLGYVADDYCLLAPGARPRIHGLFSTAKVPAATAERFPRLVGALDAARRLDAAKAVYFLETHPGIRVSSGCEARALVFPRIVDRGGVRFTRLPPAQAYAALAPSTLFQLPGSSPDDARRIADLVRRLPAFAAEIGPDIAEVPRALEELMAVTVSMVEQ